MLNRKLFSVLLLFSAVAAGNPQTESGLSVHLNVADENGHEIESFEVLFDSHEYGSSAWKTGHNGEMALGKEDFPGYRLKGQLAVRYQLIIRAAGYAPELIVLDNLKGDIQKQIILQSGKRELILRTADGREIPNEVVPMVVFSDFEKKALRSYQSWSRGRNPADLNMTSLIKTDEGRYVFFIADDSPEFYVFIDYPGFLRAFRKGPYSARDLKHNRLEIKLPKSAIVKAKFEPPSDWVGELPFEECGLRIIWLKPGTTSGYPVLKIESEGPRLEMEEEYFAPGDYWIDFYTRPAKKDSRFERGKVNPGFYRDPRRVTLNEGENKNFVFTYTPYDENGYKGDYSATITVRWPNEKTAAGESYSLYHSNRHYGHILINKGKFEDSGKIELNNVKGGEEAEHFMLAVAGGKLGRFFIQLDGRQKSRELDFTLAPIEGYEAPDVTLQDAFSSKEVKISDFAGKVIFIDFWATWCGPCQGPMAHLCQIQTKRKTDWESKAVLLAVSLDDRKETLINYVRNRGWSAALHLWCHKGESGFKSDAAKKYGISGVPTSLLINTKGKIVWRGHPGTVDIEDKIDKLLKTKQ